jgi:PAS domain S-box-containing protein
MGAEREFANDRRFKRLVDTLDHAVVWEFDDTDGVYNFVSEHSKLVLGYPCEQWLENPRFFEERVHPEDRARVLAVFDELRQRQRADIRCEHRVARADGTIIWVHSGVHFEEEGGHALFRGVTIDIDHLKQAEQRERDARAQAERTAHARDEVLAVVAHDLRNPLNTVQLALDTLAEPGTLEKNVQLIRRALGQMQSLIDDLLDAASIRASRLRIAPGVLDARSLVQEVADDFAAEAKEKGVLLAVVAGDSAQLPGDGRRLSQALSNLLNNALKFTDAGGQVTLSVDVHDEHVRIEVSDTGRGIAPDEADRVFDREWQSDETAHLGSGMGLYIAKGIVEAHAGQVNVQSMLGKGSTFAIVLPR